jgi:hypothetical protein
MTFARGRNGDVYGVNGRNRGFRWDTVTATVEQLGISAPASAPTVTASSANARFFISGVEVIDGGYGYQKVPAITFTGSQASGSAVPAAKAIVRKGRVVGVKMQRYGTGYTDAPTVACENPDLAANPGSGATLSVTTETFTGPGETTRHRVTAVSVSAGGSGYSGFPRVVFSGEGGAVAECVVGASGAISSVRLINGGNYPSAPTASVVADEEQNPRKAVLQPTLAPGIKGKYWCALRYIDDTTEAKGGPIPSSISELTAVEVSANAGSFSWSWSNAGIESRVHRIELWRTTADQALVLYKVAEISDFSAPTSTYTDSLSDAALADPSRTGFEALPITLPNGFANARRFNPPPQNKSVIAIFQDRAWYAVDVPGRTFKGGTDSAAAEPNVLYFSELDEPESVPEANQLIIQENVKGQDRITALMPFGGGMVVFQERHCYRLTYVSQPIIDASMTLIGQRGCLNQRCWDVYDGVAYVADAAGLYVLDGTNAVPLSDPVENFWSDAIIHFASSKHFFVRVDPQTRVVRFFFSVSAGLPDRALCFHPLTKAWWLEQYAQSFASAECLITGGRQRVVGGAQNGSLYLFDAGDQDINAAAESAPIACSMLTSAMAFDAKDPSRSIRVLYRPTAVDCNLSVGLHYNNSSTPRPAAVQTDRGTGFTTAAGGAAALNLKKTRSALGDATGYAVSSYAGRLDDKSSGGDRHLSVALSLSRPAGDQATLYGIAVEGVSQ